MSVSFEILYQINSCLCNIKVDMLLLDSKIITDAYGPASAHSSNVLSLWKIPTGTPSILTVLNNSAGLF